MMLCYVANPSRGLGSYEHCAVVRCVKCYVIGDVNVESMEVLDGVMQRLCLRYLDE